MAKHIPGPLYYEQQGKTGLPMVFLHSTPDDNRLWLFQTAHFSNWYRTIAVDLAGYGRSAALQDGVTMADQAEAVWELVDTITAGPVIVQGNSMGSEVAMHMADQRPERMACMILSGCGYLPIFARSSSRAKTPIAPKALRGGAVRCCFTSTRRCARRSWCNITPRWSAA